MPPPPRSRHDFIRTTGVFELQLEQLIMYPDNRPLETLASFAIAFASGMVAAAALGAYTRWVQRKADKEAASPKRG